MTTLRPLPNGSMEIVQFRRKQREHWCKKWGNGTNNSHAKPRRRPWEKALAEAFQARTVRR